MASSFLNEHKFESLLDFEVWRLHCDGVVPEQISFEIKPLGFKANKDTIYKVIARLEKLMKLGLFGGQ